MFNIELYFVTFFIEHSQSLNVFAIKNEFVGHNDTYFQSQWPHGSPKPLTVKSENSGFVRNWYTGCPKLWFMKNINDFLTLKMWPLALALIKTKTKNHLFDPLIKKCPFSMENCLWSLKAVISHVKWAFSGQWVKKMAIFCFDQCQSQW